MDTVLHSNTARGLLRVSRNDPKSRQHNHLCHGVGADDSTVLVSGDSNWQIFNGHEAYSHEDQRDKESAV